MLSENQNNENAEELDQEEDELYEHHRIEVDKGQSLLRLDKYLMIKIQNATRTKIQYAIDAESVRVNNKLAKASYQVKPDDIITVSLPYPPRDTTLLPENIPLTIIFEDEDILIVNKAPGMVVHPGFGNWSGTLVNALIYHFQNLPTSKNGEIRPGLVHRIDKDTSGLLVIAKTEFAMTHLAKQFYDHTIERTYYALVWGELKQQKGFIEGHIGRSAKDRKVMAVFPDGSQGKEAKTHYEVIKSMRYVSWVKLNLETGRTHQIRAHMKYLGHPLFNDATYGGDKIVKNTNYPKFEKFVKNCFEMCPRQALHAQSLGFVHPKTKKFMHFESELPTDIKSILSKWENFVQED
ncbi:MAG: RluA family pseudouridine synthase [Bacteroidota bacterium]